MNLVTAQLNKLMAWQKRKLWCVCVTLLPSSSHRRACLACRLESSFAIRYSGLQAAPLDTRTPLCCFCAGTGVAHVCSCRSCVTHSQAAHLHARPSANGSQGEAREESARQTGNGEPGHPVLLTDRAEPSLVFRGRPAVWLATRCRATLNTMTGPISRSISTSGELVGGSCSV